MCADSHAKRPLRHGTPPPSARKLSPKALPWCWFGGGGGGGGGGSRAPDPNPTLRVGKNIYGGFSFVSE